MRLSLARSRSRALECSPRPLFTAGLVLAAVLAAVLVAAQPAHAAGITVTTTADEYGTGPACSLREAITAANSDTAFGGCSAGSGADTLTLPAGTFQITINPGPDENANASGDFDVSSNITVNGAGAGSTIIDGAGSDRIFDIDPTGTVTCVVTLTGLTLQNGKGFSDNWGAGAAVYIGVGGTVTINNSILSDNHSELGGGAIRNSGVLVLNTVTLENNTALAGGAIANLGALSLNAVTVQNNTAIGGGGGISTHGALTVNSSAFSGNKAESGGAMMINTDRPTSFAISGSLFTGNQAVATEGGFPDNGGAIAGWANGPVSITSSSFTGNSAAGSGGAVFFSQNGPSGAVGLTMSYNRIAGNIAAIAGGLYVSQFTPATAQRNWWGCNDGPGFNKSCDGTVLAPPSVSPWIVLRHTADPGTVAPGQTTTLTAGFHKNSDGSANAAADLGAFVGVPVAFGNPVLGTLSNAQATIQSTGAATATYTAGTTTGAGSATATVDSATVTANLAIAQSAIPASVLDLRASLEGGPGSNAVTLRWSSVGPDAQHYEVWRAFDTPYFTPEAAGVRIADNIAPMGGMTYVDPDAQAATRGTAVFYLVLAVNSAGQPSTSYNRAGAMVSGLTPGLP